MHPFRSHLLPMLMLLISVASYLYTMPTKILEGLSKMKCILHNSQSPRRRFFSNWSKQNQSQEHPLCLRLTANDLITMQNLHTNNVDLSSINCRLIDLVIFVSINRLLKWSTESFPIIMIGPVHRLIDSASIHLCQRCLKPLCFVSSSFLSR